jgi:hypothetical protein
MSLHFVSLIFYVEAAFGLTLKKEPRRKGSSFGNSFQYLQRGVKAQKVAPRRYPSSVLHAVPRIFGWHFLC